MSFEIIDFHTHPFIDESENICVHKEYCAMSTDDTREVFRTLQVSKICGSVIRRELSPYNTMWDKIRHNNNTALALRELYGDFYVPGFHIHPDYIDASIAEMDRMQQNGIKLIGELVPYMDGWSDYASDAFSLLLREAGRRNMVVSIHSSDFDQMDAMAEKNKDVILVAAHPGDYHSVLGHIERMKKHENYYLDLSGTGLFRHGMLRHVIDEVGADRILFGSDYPICNPGMFIGGVLFDTLLTDGEKEKIFSENAKKLLF